MLNYTHGINFGFKNLHQATKKWLPNIVTTFLAFFCNGNYRLTKCDISCFLMLYAKF